MTKKVFPKNYFEDIKNKKDTIRQNMLEKELANSIKLYDKFSLTGQEDAKKEILFKIKTLQKEMELLKLGYETYILEEDILKYINEVSDEVVKITELSSYKRDIPTSVLKIIKDTKDIFDEMLIIYTDYTEELDVDKIEKDPILFGIFYDDKLKVINSRYYFLADWIDEYCDLTLDRMIQELSKESEVDKTFIHKISDEYLPEILLKEEESGFMKKSKKDEKKGIFKRIVDFFLKRND